MFNKIKSCGCTKNCNKIYTSHFPCINKMYKICKKVNNTYGCVVDTMGLAHPHGQDSLLPIHHLLINTETYSRVKWLLEKFSQCVWRAVSAASKQPTIENVHTEKWCLHECVLFVGNYIPTTTTAVATDVYIVTTAHVSGYYIIKL